VDYPFASRAQGLTMADKETNHRIPGPQSALADMLALAKRLRARAGSVAFRDVPEQQKDMRAAAGFIEDLAHVRSEIDRLANEVKDDVRAATPSWTPGGTMMPSSDLHTLSESPAGAL
jgi:hypothetical protein